MRRICFHVDTSKLFPFFCLTAFFCRPLEDEVSLPHKGYIVLHRLCRQQCVPKLISSKRSYGFVNDVDGLTVSLERAFVLSSAVFNQICRVGLAFSGWKGYVYCGYKILAFIFPIQL